MEPSKLKFEIFLALQCRLECESGYVAQRTPLITCVNGEYAKGCHYLQEVVKLVCLFYHETAAATPLRARIGPSNLGQSSYWCTKFVPTNRSVSPNLMVDINPKVKN